jgi:hypothetical protein
MRPRMLLGGSVDAALSSGDKYVYLNAGDTIHLGCSVVAAGATRTLRGGASFPNTTSLSFKRAD